MNERRRIFIGQILLATVFFVSSIRAQQPYKPNDLIPIDTSVTFGKFDNGLTYYLKVNKKPEKRAELRLAVRAGSVLEDDDQLGLAHFCEHMAFNGTKSYPKNELVSLLEKEGIRLGPDVNASTGFDETIYMLQIPTDADTIVEKAFTILQEWASAVTYDDNEIDKERGVVIEEWRLGRGASMRVYDKHVPKLYYGSQYARRDVIGTKDILENAPHATLRRFYLDWYRPELMAVAVVGDFDKSRMEQLIKDHFSVLTNKRPARARTEYALPDHAETLVSIATDKELTYSIASMYFERNEEVQKTFGDFRKDLVSQLYDAMFNKRIQERLQQPNPPSINGGSGDGPFLGHRRAYTLHVQTKENSILDGFEYMLTEASRVKQFGFTPTELERQKTVVLRRYEQAVKERDKTESRSYVGEYLRNFLNQEPIPSIDVEYNAVREFLPGITLDEVNKLADVKMVRGNRVITVSAPEKEGVKVPTEAEVLAVVNAVGTRNLKPYVDKVSNMPLIALAPKAGTVVSETRIESIGVTEWKLSNGARVVLKPTDFKNDQVLFTAYSNGGTSLSADSDYVSAWVASQIVSTCGIGDFDAVSLAKKLAGKIAWVYPEITVLSEGFSGSASPQDLETLFQLTYLYVTAPRKDTNAYGAMMSRWRESIQNRSASPEGAFYDTLGVTLTQYHYRARPFTTNVMDEIRLDKALSFYRDRFADASDFVFFFVGSFQIEKIKSYVEQYLASLPSLNRKESWRDVGMMSPKGVIHKEVYKGVEPKSLVRLNFSGPFVWTAQNRYDLNSMIDLLNIKLQEVIREEMSGAYSIGASAYHSKDPREEFDIQIGWGCNPTRVDELVRAVMQQLDSLKLQLPAQSYVDKVKEIQWRHREISLKENGFWLSSLRTYYTNGENPEEILNYKSFVDKLTPDAIQSAAKKYFNVNNMIRVVLYPEKK